MALGDIVLLKDRTPRGPYTRAQIQEALGRGEFSETDLAHTPGLRDWLPLSEVLHHLDHDVVKTFQPPEPRGLPPLPGAKSKLSPPVSPAISEVKETPPALPLKREALAPPDLAAAISAQVGNQLVPAPMGERFLAWVIDCSVLFVPIVALFALAYVVSLIEGSWEHQDAETQRQQHALLWRDFRDLMTLVAIGFGWLYGAGLECSRWQATVGKQWMGIIVTDTVGVRLSFLHATGRHFAKYLSAVPFFLGFMAALFNPQRLAWHDRLADTRVLRK